MGARKDIVLDVERMMRNMIAIVTIFLLSQVCAVSSLQSSEISVTGGLRTFSQTEIKSPSHSQPPEPISLSNIAVNNINCILCDVDGTLTYGKEHTISDASIDRSLIFPS